MITIISPSKAQNFKNSNVQKTTMPHKLTKSKQLIKLLKQYSVVQIAKLMTISDKLAELNHQRFQNFTTPFTINNAKQAILAFKGDAYKELSVHNYTNADLDFAQHNARIISGLYGLLKPLDLIQPYRLEMKTKLANPYGDNLYKFWEDDISLMLNKDCTDIVVNLASNEYFKSVNKNTLKAQILQIDFKEFTQGNYKIIGIYAKKARGLMLNYIIKKRITEHNKLKQFDIRGYEFNKKLSEAMHWVFTR